MVVETTAPEVALREQENRWIGSAMKTSFIVWGARSVGPRSYILAKELGITSLHFIRAGARRGILSAPVRYAYQAFRTLQTLVSERPQIVFVQSPPSLAVLSVYVYARATGARYLIDAHSAALFQRIWRWPRWLHRILVRNAITTLVTNDYSRALIQADGGESMVISDVPTHFGIPSTDPLPGTFNVAVVNTFSDDEPLDAILDAAKGQPEVDFFITGDKHGARPGVVDLASGNVHFTGFLPEGSYYALLGAADAVMCLTTREYTMQRGACEALSLGKPIITSDTQVLRSYFDRGAVHVSNTPESIRDGIRRLRTDLTCYQSEIKDLRSRRRHEWIDKKQVLTEFIQQAVNRI